MPNTNKLVHKSWNPLRGCSRVSAGCANCYAESFALRLAGDKQPYEGLVILTPNGPRWTGKIRLVPELLDTPYHWRKSASIFVNSMSDLFHKDVPNNFIDEVLRVITDCYWHNFFILTKRPQRMQQWASNKGILPENLWLGVSIEDQQAADARIPFLLDTPAQVRFLNCEPLLGPLEITHHLSTNGIHMVSAGAESGYNARPMDLNWVRALRDQCLKTEVGFSFQKELDGVRWRQIPKHLQVILRKMNNRPRNIKQMTLNFDD